MSTLGYATTIQTEKEIYLSNETIKVNLNDMLGDNHDWVGVYPVDKSNAWENVLVWKWTGGKVNTTLSLGTLPKGDYEVRAFFENKFNTEASDRFRVNQAIGEATVSTSKASYKPNEKIIVNYSNMSGDSKDWIAIYSKNSSN
jgi:hypothetical protein